jgi:lysozyme
MLLSPTHVNSLPGLGDSTVDMSEKGLALVKSFEGCYLEAYLCPAKVWTIGYGHTDNVEKGQTITKEEAERLLIKDLAWAENVVEGALKVPVTAYQFDALVSFVFNVGEGAFRKSTLLRELNKGRYDAVPGQLLRWNKAGKPKRELKGLTRRRLAEAALWNEVPPPVKPGEAEPAPEPMPQAVCPSTPPVAALVKSRTIWGTGLIGVASAGEWVLGTATQASQKTAESLSGTSALMENVGSAKSTLVLVIVLAAVAVVIAARIQDWTGGRG